MKINKHRALEMHNAGMSYAEIGREFGTTRQAVQKLLSSPTKQKLAGYQHPKPWAYPDLCKTMHMERITAQVLGRRAGFPEGKMERILDGDIEPTQNDKLRIELAIGNVSWEKG